MTTSLYRALLLFIPITLAFVGCGSNSSATQSATATPSTSAGDIPDTANYLTYSGHGFSIKYVEGWGITLKTGGVLISDKDSSERVTIAGNPQGQTVGAIAAADLARQAVTAPRPRLITKHTVRLPSGSAVYVQLQTLSPRDPVTGKQVPVVADRYYIAGTGRYAVVTLGTPLGVDNVDAFKLIARSFRWR